MPCILRTSHASSHYSMASRYAHSTSMAIRRSDGDGSPSFTVAIVFVVIGALIVVIGLWSWAKQSHAKANRKSDQNPLGRRQGGSRGRRYRQPNRPLPTNDNDLERGSRGFCQGIYVGHPTTPRVPPPSYRTKPDVVFSGPSHGFGHLGKDGKTHRAQSVGDYLQDADESEGGEGIESRRLGAPTARDYFNGR